MKDERSKIYQNPTANSVTIIATYSYHLTWTAHHPHFCDRGGGGVMTRGLKT